MKQWKKVAAAAVIALLTALIGVEAYMESRFQYWEHPVVSEDPETVFRKVPEVRISQDDLDFLEEAALYPAVLELKENRENADLWAADSPDIQAAAERFLGDDAGTLTVSVILREGSESLTLAWEGENTRTALEKVVFGECEICRKVFAPDAESMKDLYQNEENRQVQRYTKQRVWFAWMDKSLWT